MKNRLLWLAAGLLLLAGLTAAWLVLFKVNNAAERDDFTGSRAVSSQEINAAQLAKRNQPQDCWTVLGGVVYDATPVINQNPDKKEYLAQACGQDGSRQFSVLKFSNQTYEEAVIIKLNSQLKKYRLGLLAP